MDVILIKKRERSKEPFTQKASKLAKSELEEYKARKNLNHDKSRF